jgi:hypothetical protein
MKACSSLHYECSDISVTFRSLFAGVEQACRRRYSPEGPCRQLLQPTASTPLSELCAVRSWSNALRQQLCSFRGKGGCVSPCIVFQTYPTRTYVNACGLVISLFPGGEKRTEEKSRKRKLLECCNEFHISFGVSVDENIIVNSV